MRSTFVTAGKFLLFQKNALAANSIFSTHLTATSVVIEVRDLVAECLKETRFQSVQVEPPLQPLSGESFRLKSANKEEEARSDVKCVGFWRRMRQAYFDIKVVSPFARSNLNKPHKSLFHEAEQQKDREYKARINQIEQADFTPLVFTAAEDCKLQDRRAHARPL